MTTNRSSQIYKWSARNQYFAAISANLIILAHGGKNNNENIKCK